MKKTAVIAVCILTLLLLCSCGAKEQNNMNTTTQATTAAQSVTVVNGVQDADIWLLPHTEENLKTTVWGKATAPQFKAGESRSVPLCESGENGKYLLRMIDTDHFYYSANGIALKAGDTLRVTGDNIAGVTAKVTDVSGAVVATYEVFAARL